MENKEKYIYNQNDILLLTEGEYNDYQIIGLYRVLKQFDIRSIQKPSRWSYGTFDYSQRKLAEAEANGFIQEIKYDEFNFGDGFDWEWIKVICYQNQKVKK